MNLESRCLFRVNFLKLFIQLFDTIPQLMKFNLNFSKFKKTLNLSYYKNDELKRLNLRKYYVLGSVTGFLITRSIHGQRSKATVYAQLISNWAILLIILDAACDNREDLTNQEKIYLNISSAKKIFSILSGSDIGISLLFRNRFHEWVLLHETAVSENTRPSKSIENDILTASSQFAISLKKCLTLVLDIKIRKKNSQIIIESLRSLMQAQIDSLNQTSFSANDNWKWYANNVLFKKFDGIFESILWAVPTNDTETLRISGLLEGMKTIGKIFAHRQILDDLVDYKNDIRAGILATPAYILIDFDLGINNHMFPGLYDMIKRSCYISGSFTNAWNKKDTNLCHTLMLNSGIFDFFIKMIEDRKSHQPIIKRLNQLTSEYPMLEVPLCFYYNRLNKTYNRLKKQVATF